MILLFLLLSNPLLIQEVEKSSTLYEIEGKHILEVGSRDVNGSVRWIFADKGYASYLGTDIEKGEGVDYVADVYELDKHFPSQTYDIVICLETLEHLEHWHKAVIQMDKVLKKDGILIVSTPKPGFPYHGWPDDYWRYTLDDWRIILTDYKEIYAVDWRKSGCLYIARKVKRNSRIPYLELYKAEP